MLISNTVKDKQHSTSITKDSFNSRVLSDKHWCDFRATLPQFDIALDYFDKNTITMNMKDLLKCLGKAAEEWQIS